MTGAANPANCVLLAIRSTGTGPAEDTTMKNERWTTHEYDIGVSDEFGLLWEPVYRVTEEAFLDVLVSIAFDLDRRGIIDRVAANGGWWSVRKAR